MLEQNTRVAQRLGWLTFNLRWLLLLAAAFLVLTGPRAPSTAALVVLVLMGAYNFGLMLYEFVDPGRPWLAVITLALDMFLGLSLYLANGPADGRLLWLGLLPGVTATLRFNWVWAVLITTAFLVLQGALGLALTPGLQAAVMTATAAALILPIILIGAFIARQLRAHVEISVRTEYKADHRRSDVLRQHARAIYEMSSTISATLNYKDVLEAALNFGALGAEGSLASSSGLISAVLFFRDDLLHVTSSRRLTAADQRVVCGGRAGILGEVIRTGEPTLNSDPEHDPELVQFASFQRCRAVLALPLRVGYETYGVVVYGHNRAEFFDNDQRAMLVAVVNQAIIALQNAQLYRNLREEKARLIEVQEEAQKKLARDLHDGPTQAVAAIAMRANFVRRLMDRDAKAASEELFKMEDLARKTTKEIRHMLFTLRPLILESQGLTAAVQQLAEKIKENHSQEVIVEAQSDLDDRLEVSYQGVLFYIIEEAVNNARKHAQAGHIWVRLNIEGEVLAVEIQDDGVGFNVGAMDSNYSRRGSLGMVNMRERAEMIGGAVRIDSAEGRGTRIFVYVPLSAAAREKPKTPAQP
jgi:signal transduction histidine kinase